MTANTALMRSVSQLKPHQIVLMCCCTTSVIHTNLLQCPVNSNCKLQTTSSLALAYALCVTCSYLYSSLPGIISPQHECSQEHSLPGTKVPGSKSSRELSFLGAKVPSGNFRSEEQKYRATKSPWTERSAHTVSLG